VALTDADRDHLRRCLELAERGRRTAAPNPVVGAVVVHDGAVLGEGWHVRPGGDHAEVAALAAAGDARGATVYCNLEPCSHHGRTPPCADALVAAGVGRVVVAMQDPTPKVDGRGIARLRAAGVRVDVADGDAARAARRANAEWLTLALLGRPHVTYKVAVSSDGRTASARPGAPRWITGAESRALVHEMRAAAGAVAVGSGTVLADDPLLTARDVDPPAERQPLRVVFDRRGRMPAGSALMRSAGPAAPVVVERRPPAEALAALGERRIASVLLEGGATLATAFLDAGLIDRVAVFTAPDPLGDGPGMFTRDAALPPPWRERRVGADILTVSELREA
jgi:diaminohydroxyphosphoribosylaminopyrimidine deaminase / 5-amino-6-(5-phosphoribosylamino)uracil reductase